MNLFSKLFRSRDKPKDYLSVHWPFLFGGTAAGRNVNERTSMQVTAVYACVRILSEAIASLPLNVYQYVENGSKEKIYNHPLYFPHSLNCFPCAAIWTDLRPVIPS